MANYRIAELDFDAIKINLKSFLTNYRDKDNNLIFKDYDFDASSLSILLDLLSYNTHYNAYLANMVANEMFLDSAVKRESAVSIAKHMGYTPLSFRSARAKVTFTVLNPIDLPTSLTLRRYSPFTTNINGTEYTFVNLDPVIISPVDGSYTFTDVEIVEGEPLTYSYRVDLSGPSEKYTIPNNNIDTSTIRVTVQNSYTDLTTEQYTLSENLSAVLPTSKVFFLEENPSGLYEIFFGDGILGKKLTSGNIVRIEYLVSHGDECNVSSGITQNFSLGTTIGGVSLDSSIVASSNSTGGGAGDTIDEIKFKAPRFLSSFNRAVTANDYKALIEANFPLVESIAVWGGEENNPPMYGKVIISLKPYEGYSISDTVKTSIIKDILSSKKVMSIIPEFVDPNYLYISIDARIKFSSKNSKYNSQDIELLVVNTIENYFRKELQKFNKNFIYSKLSKSIDSIDSSIIGNVISLKIQKRISPVVGAENGFSGSSVIKFENKLVSGSIKSTAFYYNTNTANTNINSVYIQDNLTTASTSSLDLIDFYSGTKLVSGIGTVNYNTGEISIPSLIPAGYIENSPDIRISAKIEEMDIQSTNNLILIIDDTKLDTLSKRTSGLTVTVISE
jgi:hypothetical protein